MPLFLSAAILVGQQPVPGTETRYFIDAPMRAPSGKPVWADEFSGRRLDTKKWSVETAFNRPGWFNNERQYYAAENLRVADGMLTIEGRREDLSKRADWGGQPYSSGRITTQGHASWTYGFYEIRAKIPCSPGTWPAIWMMPDAKAPWPNAGEIDIMEAVGSQPNVVHATLHTEKFVHSKNTQRGSQLPLATSCSAFHRYQMEWSPQAITIGVDDRAYFRVTNDTPGDRGAWPFDGPFHMILNLAIGGDWPGRVDDAQLPQRMQVDYVRVWGRGR